jgi:acetyl-CoA carboxylase biotin carboxyl carrier protein
VIVRAEISGQVWKVETGVGRAVVAGEALLVLESMKMEIPVEAPQGGVVAEIRVKEGDAVREGDVLVVLTIA